MDNVTIDLYKGHNISNSFGVKEEKKILEKSIVEKVVDSFKNNHIEEEVFEKALSELSSVNNDILIKAEEGFEIEIESYGKVVNNNGVWDIQKAKTQGDNLAEAFNSAGSEVGEDPKPEDVEKAEGEEEEYEDEEGDEEEKTEE